MLNLASVFVPKLNLRNKGGIFFLKGYCEAINDDMLHGVTGTKHINSLIMITSWPHTE